MLSEKDEIRMTAGMPGYISVAYSPAENVGIYASSFFTREMLISESRTQKGDHFTMEFAGGYYKKDPDNDGIVEVYGGIGVGKFSIKEEGLAGNFRFKSPTMKIFIHPSIGWKRKKFEAAFNFRITGLKFGNYSTNFSNESIVENRLEDLNRGMDFFIEPAITLRFGLKNVKFDYQSGVSLPFRKSPSYSYLPVLGTFGISVNLTKDLFKNKSKYSKTGNNRYKKGWRLDPIL